MHIRWEGAFEIRASVADGTMAISANREGLISLANIMRDLADGRPSDHVHLDEYNALEEGSCELIIERVD